MMMYKHPTGSFILILTRPFAHISARDMRALFQNTNGLQRTHLRYATQQRAYRIPVGFINSHLLLEDQRLHLHVAGSANGRYWRLQVIRTARASSPHGAMLVI
jgi:hypothetical protein